MKVVVSIPTYSGDIPCRLARCLLDELVLSKEAGVDLQFSFLPNCSHVAMGRNQLACDFLESDADKLFFLDSDLTFEPGAILKVVSFDESLVGGAYRYKRDDEIYPVGWLDKPELWSNEQGLLEVMTLPGGFLSISREVFLHFKHQFPDREYEHFGRIAFGFFQMRIDHGQLWGEDSLFCTEWRVMDEKVFLYPELNITHWDGNKSYEGHIGNWLKLRMT